MSEESKARAFKKELLDLIPPTSKAKIMRVYRDGLPTSEMISLHDARAAGYKLPSWVHPQAPPFAIAPKDVA